MCKDCGCDNAAENQHQVLSVPGMVCENCKAAVEGALLKIPGVNSAVVDLEAKNVAVDFNGTQVNTDQMITAITAAGFDVDKDALIEKAKDGVMGTISKFFK